MRTFIAIDIPDNDNIREIYQYLPLHIKGAKIKYTAQDQNHLTLAFLGEVDEHGINNLKNELSVIQLGISDIMLQLSGLGIFRTNRQPSVIWIGIAMSDEQRKLHELINIGVQHAGININSTKEFFPHITLGRVKFAEKDNNIIEITEKFKSTNFGKLKINSFNLYKSTLTPNGPIYEVLKTFSLQ